MPANPSAISWLDDAEIDAPAHGAVDVSVARWNTSDGGETYAPVLSVGIGVTSRLQLSASVPRYRAKYTNGYKGQGLGDSYFSAKTQLVDPGEHPLGIAVSGVLEVLSHAAVSDPALGLSRVNWALPVSIQVGNDETVARAYGTVGYVSRGAALVGFGVEGDLTPTLTLMGAVNYSYATRTPGALTTQRLSRSRTDADGTINLDVTRTVAVYASAGRTISTRDQSGATLLVSAGVRVSFGPRPRRP